MARMSTNDGGDTRSNASKIFEKNSTVINTKDSIATSCNRVPSSMLSPGAEFAYKPKTDSNIFNSLCVSLLFARNLLSPRYLDVTCITALALLFVSFPKKHVSARSRIVPICVWTLMMSGCAEASQYRLVNQTMDFMSAMAYCRTEFGTDLASIHNDADNEEAQALCQSASLYCWIGLNDIRVEGNWSWTDGTSFDYGTTPFRLPWSAQSPNNANGNQDCVQLWADSLYQWDDLGCHVEIYFLCASPTVSTETPSVSKTPAIIYVGVAIACILALIAALFCTYYVLRKRRKRRETKTNVANSEQQQTADVVPMSAQSSINHAVVVNTVTEKSTPETNVPIAKLESAQTKPVEVVDDTKMAPHLERHESELAEAMYVKMHSTPLTPTSDGHNRQQPVQKRTDLGEWCHRHGFDDLCDVLQRPPISISSLQELKELSNDEDIRELVKQLGLRFGRKVQFMQAMRKLVDDKLRDEQHEVAVEIQQEGVVSNAEDGQTGTNHHVTV